MGSCNSGGKGSDWTGGNSSVDSANIISTTSLISAREGQQEEVDEVLQTFKDINDEYGFIINDIELATIGGKDANTMAYYDGSNIAVNQAYFSKARIEGAYERCVADGFHPPKGNKTALQAVASHELGHALVDKVSTKMGRIKGDDTATAILKEAQKQGKFKGSLADMAGKISGYAKFNPNECIAEAFSDVYCNGSKAQRESKAIVNVMNKYLKP